VCVCVSVIKLPYLLFEVGHFTKEETEAHFIFIFGNNFMVGSIWCL